MFNLIDKNNDGVIDLSEWEAAAALITSPLSEIVPGLTLSEVRAASLVFDALDFGGDGNVNVGQLLNVYGKEDEGKQALIKALNAVDDGRDV